MTRWTSPAWERNAIRPPAPPSTQAALAEMVVPDSSVLVGDVHGGPVPVAEGLPDRVVAVERDGILDPHLLRRLADVVDVPLERKLQRVDADHHEALIRVLLGPGAD